MKRIPGPELPSKDCIPDAMMKTTNDMPGTKIDQSDATNDHAPPYSITDNRNKLSKYDTAVLTLASADPGLSLNAIANKIKDSGLSKSVTTVYKRWSKNQYLRAGFEAIQQHARQQMASELLPIALDEHKKALKDKTLHPRDKFMYIKQAEDKILADKRDADAQSPVQIGHIERLQVLIQGALLPDNNSESK